MINEKGEMWIYILKYDGDTFGAYSTKEKMIADARKYRIKELNWEEIRVE